MHSKKRTFVILLLLLSPYCALAQSLADEFADDGRLMYSSKPTEQDYRLALSDLKRVNNQWRVSREQKIHGIVERKTVEFNSSTTFSEAKKRLQLAVAKIADSTIAYTCEGLDCGSSSGWANHVLGLKILYGLDLYQYYTVVHSIEGDSTLHTVFYLVQRGSGRIYLQQDIVRSQTAAGGGELLTETSVLKQLKNSGFWTIAGSEDNLQKMSSIELELISRLMSKNRRWSLAIVGHDYQSGDLDGQRQRSLLHAKVIEQQLLAAGVNATRLRTYGLGSLAPAGRVGKTRVELVLELQ